MSASSSDLHPIAHYCRAIPGSRGAARLHPATVSRWILSGVGTPTGRIRLTATRYGSRWLIREDDFHAFLRALTATSLPADEHSSSNDAEHDRRHSDQAARRLKQRHGL